MDHRRGFRSAPPGGGDHLCRRRDYLDHVSIRAPGWGRPHGAVPRLSGNRFRSAPPGGGDTGDFVTSRPPSCFDPRPRVGATDEAGRVSGAARVSIRAPGWGRPGAPWWRPWGRCFDPRPRVGATCMTASTRPASPAFRSAPPGGGDRHRAQPVDHPERFRSAPPGGGDRSSIVFMCARTWFRSAPPGGGDVSAACGAASDPGFDPRPRVGATTVS